MDSDMATGARRLVGARHARAWQWIVIRWLRLKFKIENRGQELASLGYLLLLRASEGHPRDFP